MLAAGVSGRHRCVFVAIALKEVLTEKSAVVGHFSAIYTKWLLLSPVKKPHKHACM